MKAIKFPDTPEILFEDEDLIAVNKPAGLISQATPDREHVQGWILRTHRVKTFLHHRLDRNTSGVILLTKTARWNTEITNLFREHQVQKTYWALTKPGKEKWDQISVRNYLAPVRNDKKQLSRMVVVRSGGWLAVTEFKKLAAANDFDWVEANPETGRTHQIRVHLASLKQPILGDFLYGGKSPLAQRTLLHARALDFIHPGTGERVKIEAPAPQDFATLLERIRRESL